MQVSKISANGFALANIVCVREINFSNYKSIFPLKRLTFFEVRC